MDPERGEAMTDWRALPAYLTDQPPLTITCGRWPYNPRTSPPELWADLIHDATWEGEE
tara:strand:+ start:479 stop:652 length:174 start_codon:yes stop_codon:yes gene_type:complete